MSLKYRPRKGPICNILAFQDFVAPPIAGEFVRSLCEEDTSQNGEFLYGALRVSDMSLFRHGVPDLAHLVSFPGVVDGVEPGLDVVGDGGLQR